MEHNTFCVSAHYRNCPGETWLQVIKAVEEILAGRGDDELRITRGRKVMEIRPRVSGRKRSWRCHGDVICISNGGGVGYKVVYSSFKIF